LTGWVSTPAHWLFPVKALSAMFRGKFCAGLQALYQAGRLEFHGQIARLASRPAFQCLLGDAAHKPWVVYAKRPFAGPETVLAYLARYTHRIGLTNYRLRDLDPVAHTVTFAYKDYADRSRQKTLRLDCGEFIRRLRLHILPPRFVKIRHYGLLANRNRHARIAVARAALPPAPSILPLPTEPKETAPQAEPPSGLPRCCPHCHAQTDWFLVAMVLPSHPRALRCVPYLDSS
jgi:hypothetical protein